ncbi:MAG: hypothetical protein V1792_28320 [Pseudomonadota bacterium]
MVTVILLLTGLMFLAQPAADVGHAGTPEQIMQEWASDKREACLENCRQWVEGYGDKGRHGKSSRFQARMYARCVAECERRFWKEWDREMKELDSP